MPISNQKHLQQFPQFFFEKDGSSVFFISTLTPIIIFLPQKNFKNSYFQVLYKKSIYKYRKTQKNAICGNQF